MFQRGSGAQHKANPQEADRRKDVLDQVTRVEDAAPDSDKIEHSLAAWSSVKRSSSGGHAAAALARLLVHYARSTFHCVSTVYRLD